MLGVVSEEAKDKPNPHGLSGSMPLYLTGGGCFINGNHRADIKYGLVEQSRLRMRLNLISYDVRVRFELTASSPACLSHCVCAIQGFTRAYSSTTVSEEW